MIVKRPTALFQNIGNGIDKNALVEKTYMNVHLFVKTPLMASQSESRPLGIDDGIDTSLIDNAEHQHANMNSIIMVPNNVDNKLNNTDSLFFSQINFDDFFFIQHILTEDITTPIDITAALNYSNTRVSSQTDVFHQSNRKFNFASSTEIRSLEFCVNKIGCFPTAGTNDSFKNSCNLKSMHLEKVFYEIRNLLNSLVNRAAVMSEHCNYTASNAMLHKNTQYKETVCVPNASTSKSISDNLLARKTNCKLKEIGKKFNKYEENEIKYLTSVAVEHVIDAQWKERLEKPLQSHKLHEIPRVIVETLQGSYVDRCVSVWNRFIGCTKSDQKKNVLYTVKELHTLFEERRKQTSENEAKDSSKDEVPASGSELIIKRKNLDGAQQQSPISRHAVKSRLRHINHSFACHVRPGIGKKLSSFENVVARVKAASPTSLRVLHFVLFGTYGQYSTDKQLNTTKANILLFSGFPYDVQSDIYIKKKKILLRLPFPILLEIQSVLCLNVYQEKTEIVYKLLQFLWKPSEVYHQKEQKEENTEDFDNEEYTWKQQALYSRCFVSLDKLNEDFIEQMTSSVTQTIESRIQAHKRKIPKKTFSSFIQASRGPGCQLKDCYEVAKNINSVKSKVVKLLHVLLFGQPNSGPQGRCRILHFSGFTDMRRSTAQQRASFLARLANWELREIHTCLGLGLNGFSRAKQIEKILHFLRSPRSYPLVNNCKQAHENIPFDTRSGEEDEQFKAIENLPIESNVVIGEHTLLQNGAKNSPIQHQRLHNEYESSVSRKEYSSQPIIKLMPYGLKHNLLTLKNGSDIEQTTQNVKSIKLPKLVEIKDFERMCFNITNATFSDLKPLYDLFFLCSSQTEISDMRERILGFKLSNISNMQSTEFLCRKTLLSLMSSQQQLTVGRLLDIPLRSGLPELTDTVLRLLAKLQ